MISNRSAKVITENFCGCTWHSQRCKTRLNDLPDPLPSGRCHEQNFTSKTSFSNKPTFGATPLRSAHAARGRVLRSLSGRRPGTAQCIHMRSASWRSRIDRLILFVCFLGEGGERTKAARRVTRSIGDVVSAVRVHGCESLALPL